MTNRRIFNTPRDQTNPNPETVLGPYRASDGLYDVYADGYLHSRHEKHDDAQGIAQALKERLHINGRWTLLDRF